METKIQKQAEEHPTPSVTVTVRGDGAAVKTFHFTQNFKFGRGSECEVQLRHTVVSRVHAEVVYEQERWWVRDLDSTNGVYKDGKKIVEMVPVTRRTVVSLGIDGPVITLELEGEKQPGETMHQQGRSLSQYIRHYFADSPAGEAGDHTQMLRKAFQEVRKTHSKKYMAIIATTGVLLIAASAYAWFKHEQVVKAEALGEDIFYELKELELAHARLLEQVNQSGATVPGEEVRQYEQKRTELITKYDEFVRDIGVYDGMSEERRTIYRVARVFGECEINMPKDFVSEVEDYISDWSKSSRMRTAIRRAQENGYPSMIADALLQSHMPPQFFYLALQESDFDPSLCGPPTRYGIAKGMWQFIPATARHYGLRTGPLVDVPREDPRDERHDVTKASRAAANYIRDIYSGDAQASGLLVMASYNWGDTVVRGLIRKMPQNPRQRNFWQFFKTYRSKLPKQTYDYVFKIFSAAVIGENPALFGFDFQNPVPPGITTATPVQQ